MSSSTRKWTESERRQLLELEIAAKSIAFNEDWELSSDSDGDEDLASQNVAQSKFAPGANRNNQDVGIGTNGFGPFGPALDSSPTWAAPVSGPFTNTPQGFNISNAEHGSGITGFGPFGGFGTTGNGQYNGLNAPLFQTTNTADFHGAGPQTQLGPNNSANTGAGTFGTGNPGFGQTVQQQVPRFGQPPQGHFQNQSQYQEFTPKNSQKPIITPLTTFAIGGRVFHVNPVTGAPERSRSQERDKKQPAKGAIQETFVIGGKTFTADLQNPHTNKRQEEDAQLPQGDLEQIWESMKGTEAERLQQMWKYFLQKSRQEQSKESVKKGHRKTDRQQRETFERTTHGNRHYPQNHPKSFAPPSAPKAMLQQYPPNRHPQSSSIRNTTSNHRFPTGPPSAFSNTPTSFRPPPGLFSSRWSKQPPSDFKK